jgi:hypothetical protein
MFLPFPKFGKCTLIILIWSHLGFANMVVKTELHTLSFTMSYLNTHLCLRLVKTTWLLRQQCPGRCQRRQACLPVNNPQFFLNSEILKSTHSFVRSRNYLFTKIKQLCTVKMWVLWQKLYSVVCNRSPAIRILSKDQFFFIKTPTRISLAVQVWFTS